MSTLPNRKTPSCTAPSGEWAEGRYAPLPTALGPRPSLHAQVRMGLLDEARVVGGGGVSAPLGDPDAGDQRVQVTPPLRVHPAELAGVEAVAGQEAALLDREGERLRLQVQILGVLGL